MKATYILLLIIVIKFSGFACSCAYTSSYFCPSISQFPPHAIIKGKVIDISEPYMTINLMELIDGQIAIGGINLTIFGQDGVNCNEWLYNFKRRDTVVLGLFSFTNNDTFDLSGCGKYYLHVKSNQMVGMVDSLSGSLTYTEFRNNLYNCKAINNINERSENLISVYPNPAHKQLNVKGLFNKPYSFKLYNSAGIIVVSESVEYTNNHTIDLSSFNSGMYFLAIENDNNINITKVIVAQ